MLRTIHKAIMEANVATTSSTSTPIALQGSNSFDSGTKARLENSSENQPRTSSAEAIFCNEPLTDVNSQYSSIDDQNPILQPSQHQTIPEQRLSNTIDISSKTELPSRPLSPDVSEKSVTWMQENNNIMSSTEYGNNLHQDPLSPVSMNQKINSFLPDLSKDTSSSGISNKLTFENSDDNESNCNDQPEHEVSVPGLMFIMKPGEIDIESNQRKSKILSLLPDHHEHVDELSWDEFLSYVYYISTFGIIGTILRMYIERFFGLDCTMKGSSDAVDDWFQQISSNIFVTTNGETNQTGGALFSVLPCNMIGAFIMGLLNPVDTKQAPIPWYPSDHPLQTHNGLHLGFRVGLCGSLTTFSSWNTQMVVMLDGSGTVLGSQVGSALFGYIIGVGVSVSSFTFGQHVGEWMRAIYMDQSDSLNQSGTTSAHCSKLDVLDVQNEAPPKVKSSFKTVQRYGCYACGVRVGPLFCVAALFALFVVGDVHYGMVFYRTMWMSMLSSPAGSISRWRLSRLNLTGSRWGKYSVEWFPWGTFLANIIGSVISIVMKSSAGNIADQQSAIVQTWMLPLLNSISDGMAGSLSTVSTLVKEMMLFETPARRCCYCWTTILCSMILALCLYRPILLAG